MNHISHFKSIKESFSISPSQEIFLNYYITGDWTISRSTGLVDVKGDFAMSAEGIRKIPIGFGHVDGDFFCNDNAIRSLENSPIEVEKTFHCGFNRIISLEFSPLKVGGDFLCYGNSLESLENSPREIGGDFACWLNKLSTLRGAPEKVGGDFACQDNTLISLEGAPLEIGGAFICDAFVIPAGKWGIIGWIDAFEDVIRRGGSRNLSLVLSLLNPQIINQEIQKNPGQMLMSLKSVWKTPEFASVRRKIKIPDRYAEEMETLGDLDDLGF